jgi:hypothetical protein
MKELKEKSLFLILFTIVGFITLQVPFTKLAGSNVSFTLFDFFGPIAAAFLGPVIGIISVLTMEIVNILVNHTPLTQGVVIRLFPMLFGTLYFGILTDKKYKNGQWILVIPFLSILAFVTHPIGRTVWYYSFFWIIPVVVFFRRDILLLRSLGATFTAHAVGGAAWIWAFSLPAVVWKGLIPTVIMERFVMTLGIAASYTIMKEILGFLISKKYLPPVSSPALLKK